MIEPIQIADFIFTLIKYDKQSKVDLEYAYNIFLDEEYYEKCSVIKELIDINYYDNKKKNSCDTIQYMIDSINLCDNDNPDMIRLEKEILSFVNNVEKLYDGIVIPPLKNIKHLKFFK